MNNAFASAFTLLSLIALAFAPSFLGATPKLEPMEPPRVSKADQIKSVALQLHLGRPFPKKVVNLLEKSKIIIMGEMHGTEQVQDLFFQTVLAVADSKSKTLVALEVDQASQGAIDQFLKTGDESVLKQDPFFKRPYQDGRSSKAMVGLLKKLSQIPNVSVVCIDPMEGVRTMTAQDRDTGMAALINSRRKGYDRTLVLVGNVHSSLVVGTPWDKDFRPLAHELESMSEDLLEKSSQEIPLLNILVRYGQVNSWNCMGATPDTCSAQYRKKKVTDYSTALNWDSYFILENELTDGHRASLFVRTTKVSPPFISVQ